MSNSKLFLVSFVIFLLTVGGMLWTEQQAGCGKIIIPLELTPDIASFKKLIAGCDIEWLKRNTLLDFFFLITYSATLYFAVKSLSVKLAPFAWFTLLPAAFDAVENILLIKFLHADVADVSGAAFGTYYMCVRIKFVILIIVLVTLLVLAIKNLYARLQGK